MTIVLSLDDNNIYEEDLESLRFCNWIRDSIIDYGIIEHHSHLPDHIRTQIVPLYASTAILCTFLSDAKELASSLASFHLTTSDIVLIPVVQSDDYTKPGGTHWSLLVFLRKALLFQRLFYSNPKIRKAPTLTPESPVFLHIDSSGDSNMSCAKEFMNKFIPLLLPIRSHSKVDLYSIPSPQQQNSFDCGVYLILSARLSFVIYC